MVENRPVLVDLSFPLHVTGGVCQTGQEKDASSQILVWIRAQTGQLKTEMAMPAVVAEPQPDLVVGRGI